VSPVSGLVVGVRILLDEVKVTAAICYARSSVACW